MPAVSSVVRRLSSFLRQSLPISHRDCPSAFSVMDIASQSESDLRRSERRRVQNARGAGARWAAASLAVLSVLGLNAGSRAEAQITAHANTFVSGITAVANPYLAVNSAGTIYSVQGTNAIHKGSFSSAGVYSEAALTITPAFTASGIAVDSSGNVYVSENTGTGAAQTHLVEKFTSGAGVGVPIYTVVNGVAAAGVAVDTSGNVYTTDQSGTLNVTTPGAGGIYTTATYADGTPDAVGISVGVSGAVYLIGTSSVVKLTPVGNPVTSYTRTVLFSTGAPGGVGVTVDGLENLYAVDNSNSISKLLQGATTPSTFRVANAMPSGVAASANGDVFFASGTTISKAVSGQVLPITNVGTLSASVPVSFVIDSNTGATAFGTFTNANVLTQGVAGADFTMATGGTCAGSTPTAGSACTVNVTFTPLAPGVRLGAANVTDATGNIVGTAYISGVATGPQGVLYPGTQSIPVTVAASSVAVDPSGILFALDSGSITKAVPTGNTYTQSTFGSGLVGSSMLALDGSGNVFVADSGNNRIVKEALAGGTYTQSVVGNVTNATGVAVDGSGSVYATDGATGLYKFVAAGGTYTSTQVPLTASSASGVAIDGIGNLFVVDHSSNNVIELAVANGAYTQSTVVTGLSGPTGITVDAAGDLYISDSNTNRVVVAVPSAGTYTVSPVLTGITQPNGLALDRAGNLFVGSHADGHVVKLDVADAQTFNFPSTAVGSTSTSQAATLTNIGNAGLIFTVPATGTNPSVSDGFTITSSTCPALTTASTPNTAADTVAAGTSCTLSIAFAPIPSQAGNTVNGSVMFTDNNLNSSTGVTQSVALSGPVQAPTAPTITAAFNPTSVSVNGTSTLTFTVMEPSTNTGGLTNVGFSDTLPSGLIVSTPLTNNTSCGGTVAAAAGGTSIVVSGATISAPGGQCSFSVNITPTSGGTGSYTTTTSIVSSTESTGTTTASATLTVPQPTITSVNPMQGYTTGGNSVTITGTNFTPGSTVTFGGTAATVTSVSANGTAIIVTVPAHAVGTVDVVVTTLNGTVTATSGFTYQSVALTPGTLQNGTYGTAYTQTIQPALVLVPAYTFALAAGSSLPAGLTLTAGPAANSATISGTPTAAGITNFTITTTDDLGISYNTNYSITIAPALLSVVVDSKSFTYAGTYPTLTGTATGYKNGDTATSVGLAFATTTPTTNTSTPGTYPISATITSANYTLAITNGTLTINKATPVLTAPTASPITFGQALSASALTGGTATFNGANVTGSFAWTDGTIMPTAGPHSYSVTFTPDAASSPTFTTATITVAITVGKATPTLTAPNASAITYGQTLASSTFTGGTAMNGTVTVAGSFAWVDSTIAPNAGTPSYNVLFTPTDTANYNSNTVLTTVTVNKATPTLTAPTASTITFGQMLSDSILTGGSAARGAIAVGGTFAWTDGTIKPPAGTPSYSVTFTPTDTANYNQNTINVSLTVNKATPTVTVAPTASDIIYGQMLSASTFSGGQVLSGSTVVAGTYTWSDGTIKPTAGTHTYLVNFTPTDSADYNPTTTMVSVVVMKATPTITRVPSASPIVYGAKLSTSSLTNGAASVPGGFAWTDGTVTPNAGTAPYPVTFTPTDTANYNNVSLTASLFVARAVPVINTPPTASPITYGQPLSASVLSGGSAVTSGKFTWTNGATIPSAGSTATYSVTFTPDDSANYNPNTINVALVVGKATPTVNTPPTASSITYGQTLAASTLTGGSASTAGTFAWTNSALVPNGGTASYSVTFTPTDTANYNGTTAMVSVTVNKAAQTITFTQPTSPATFGDAPITLVATASSNLVPTFSVISGPGTISGKVLTITGAGNIVIAADQAGDGNYTAATQVRRTVVVNVQPQTITFTQPASPISYSANAAVALMATGGASSNAVTFKVLSGPGTISGSTLTILGAGSIIVAADQTGDANYGAATEMQRTIVVNPATQTITFNQPSSPIPYGSTQTFSVSATGGASGNPVTYAIASGPGTINGTTVTITGTGSIVVAADQAGNANYGAATEVQRTVVVAKATATLTGPASQPVAVGATQGASIPVTVTGQYSGPSIAPPSGAISYSILNASSTSVASGSLTISGGSVVVPVPATLAGGSYSIVLNYAGDANYAVSTLTISIVVQQFQPVIVWAQPAAITYGTTLAGVLTATAQDQNGATPKTVPGTFAYSTGSTAVTSATVLPVGSYTLSVTFTPSDSSAYKTATGSVTLVVTKAAASVTVQASAITILLQNPLTLTATASANGSPATGSVTFLDGTATLGTGTLINGVASFTTSSLAAGTHSITAVYAGDTNFTGQTSPAVTVQVADFGFTLANGSSSLSIPRGSTATYNFTLSPTGTATFPAAVNLTLAGLPAGATYTIAPSTVLAGSGATNVTLTINIPAQLSMLRKVEGLAPLTFALLLLPFSGRIRRRAGRLTRVAAAMLLLVGGAFGAATLTGCGGNSGSGSGQQGPQTYNVVITGTSGTLTHSTTVTLTVQ